MRKTTAAKRQKVRRRLARRSTTRVGTLHRPTFDQKGQNSGSPDSQLEGSKHTLPDPRPEGSEHHSARPSTRGVGTLIRPTQPDGSERSHADPNPKGRKTLPSPTLHPSGRNPNSLDVKGRISASPDPRPEGSELRVGPKPRKTEAKGKRTRTRTGTRSCSRIIQDSTGAKLTAKGGSNRPGSDLRN